MKKNQFCGQNSSYLRPNLKMIDLCIQNKVFIIELIEKEFKLELP